LPAAALAAADRRRRRNYNSSVRLGLRTAAAISDRNHPAESGFDELPASVG
jgi:hypothetical protein